MSTKNELSRITIDIPKADHKRLKSMAAILGKSMREIVVELIDERLQQDEDQECPHNHVPNAETLKAIKNAVEGKNLVKSKNAKEFFKKMGIKC